VSNDVTVKLSESIMGMSITSSSRACSAYHFAFGKRADMFSGVASPKIEGGEFFMGGQNVWF